MAIYFGPGGLGSVKDAVNNLQKYHEMGISACEVEFTYGVYIKNEKDAVLIGEAAKKLGIKLSIHAQYWINLNSKEKKKIEESKKRILDCCRIGEKLGAYRVVFHAGFFGGMDQKNDSRFLDDRESKDIQDSRHKEESYLNIKNAVLDIMKEIKENKWKIKIAAETMGKINVFGSVEEIARLTEDTGCSFCIDFAHILARDKKVDFSLLKEKFGKHKEWHCHFSGIVYGEKGEKHHVLTTSSDWNELLKELKSFSKEHEIVIINESPDPIGDSVKGLKMMK